MRINLTDEEEQLIEDYIYKTYLIDLLEKDHQAINSLNFKLKEPYERLFESTLKQLRIEMRDIKSNFKELKAKVEGPEVVNVEFLEYKYFIRGYQGVKRLFMYHFRNEANRLLESYFLKK